ncbi:MAG TPA: hypothetical protein ENH04_07210, partial [Nitrospirae bacterium]|nr:hypothetical protein [Nitrospirota bacterium]
MSKIILIDEKWDFNSPISRYALKMAKGSDTEIVGVCLTGDAGDETSRAQAVLSGVKQKFASEGIDFSSYIIGPDPDAFMKRIDSLMPASLVILGDITFSDEMIRGGANIDAIKSKFQCPVATVDAITLSQEEKRTAEGINWGRWIIYAIGSVLMYAVFFPKIEALNKKIFMAETVLGGLAIMVVVAVHAWIWGNT